MWGDVSHSIEAKVTPPATSKNTTRGGMKKRRLVWWLWRVLMVVVALIIFSVLAKELYYRQRLPCSSPHPLPIGQQNNFFQETGPLDLLISVFALIHPIMISHHFTYCTMKCSWFICLCFIFSWLSNARKTAVPVQEMLITYRSYLPSTFCGGKCFPTKQNLGSRDI